MMLRFFFKTEFAQLLSVDPPRISYVDFKEVHGLQVKNYCYIAWFITSPSCLVMNAIQRSQNLSLCCPYKFTIYNFEMRLSSILVILVH